MVVLRHLALLAALFAGSAALPDDATIELGEYLLAAGGCISCHTADEDQDTPLSGGRALDSPFGTFYAPNITPDVETGIGEWTDEEFIRAFREGVSPNGEHYYPAFPYTAYTGVSDNELLAIKAYLDSQPPVRQPNRPHELAWYVQWRGALLPWKWLYFEPGPVDVEPGDPVSRGSYLVNQLGHCGECHSPRGSLGGLVEERYMAGNPEGPEGDKVPNITSHPDDGIGSWSADDIAFFLEIGMLPNGDFTGGSMGEVIDHNTSRLTPEDRAAIAAFLKSIPPIPSLAEPNTESP